MPAAMTHALVPRRLAAVAMLVSLLVGCAAPTPIARDGPVSGSAAAVAAAPRFAPGGPDADEYGIDDGFPTGDRTTFFSTPFLVGSHSERDRIFDRRLLRPADTPWQLARAASEPVGQYYFHAAAAAPELHLLRPPTPGLPVPR